MKSSTSYRNISFVIYNLFIFTLLVGLQSHFLYTIIKTVAVAAVKLPQKQAVIGTTASHLESFQFNDFDTIRATLASSSSSSWSSSASPLKGAKALQHKISSPSTSSVAYPTLTTTKTFPVMSSINIISPTQTIKIVHTTFKTRSSSRDSSDGYSGVRKKSLVTSLSSYTPTTIGGSEVTNAAGLSSFKNIKKSKSNIKTSNSNSSRTKSSFYNNGQQQQKDFPLDFTFSKNHWANSDDALNRGVDAAIVGTSSNIVGSNGNADFRLASLSSVTFSASSSSTATMETERPRIFRNKHHHERHWGPFFEEPLNSTTSGDNSITTAHLYTEAVLNCRVGMLKDKTLMAVGLMFSLSLLWLRLMACFFNCSFLLTFVHLNVMWVRRTSEKVSLLTVGNVTYSSDPRIRVKFQYPNNWRLLINPTQWNDAGIYMCQVSTHPPRVFTTNLTVIEPPLRLIDDQERDVGDRYYKTGSTIDLQCQVSRSFLYKEKQKILKSLKPFYIHNIGNTTINTSSSNTSTPTASTSSRFRGTNDRSSGSNNTLSPGHSNNYNKNQTKVTANKNSNKDVSIASNNNGIFSPSTTISTGFGIFNKDLSQSLKQSATSADNQGIAFEQQFSSLMFWSKDDVELPSTTLNRVSSDDKWVTSRVTIIDAKLTDSGNYSCSIGRMFTAIVQVEVLTGELPAAVQHNSATAIVLCKVCVRELIQLYWIYITATYFITY